MVASHQVRKTAGIVEAEGEPFRHRWGNDAWGSGPCGGIIAETNGVGHHVGPSGRVVARVPVALKNSGVAYLVISEVFGGGCCSVIGGSLHGAGHASSLHGDGPTAESPVGQSIVEIVSIDSGLGLVCCCSPTVHHAVGQGSACGVVLRSTRNAAVPSSV